MNRVDGKVCVVTGGTQGLGAAVARRLAEAGAAGIVTCGRGEAKGRAVAEAVGCLVPAFVEASSDLPELLRQLHEVTHNMRQLTTDLRSA